MAIVFKSRALGVTGAEKARKQKRQFRVFFSINGVPSIARPHDHVFQMLDKKPGIKGQHVLRKLEN